MEGQNLIEIKGYYQGTTNTRHLSLVYSVKNRKFVKGFLDGSSTHGYIRYRLFPGKYIKIYYDYWNKADPPNKVEVSLISIEEDGKEKELKSVCVHFYNCEFLKRFPPQLMDLYEKRPGYHRKPAVHLLFTKQYTEEENENLLKIFDGPKIYREGEEHD